jgi:hypothetical protein
MSVIIGKGLWERMAGSEETRNQSDTMEDFPPQEAGLAF